MIEFINCGAARCPQPNPIGKRNLDTVVPGFAGLRPDSPLKVIGAPISFSVLSYNTK